MNQQMALQYARGLIDSGMSVADANVELVRMLGVRIVEGRMSKDVRAALMNGVKSGKLGRLPKDGMKPEAFFHPNSVWVAKEKRNQIEASGMSAMLAICGTGRAG